MTQDETFTELTAAEPRLLDLVREARAHRHNPDARFCANAVFFGHGPYRGAGLKAQLCQLVGFSRAGHDLLGTRTAYGVAYKTIYGALPDCRGCGCPGR